MAYLDLKDLHKAFGAARVVSDFTLAVERGEFVSFLGPSGCGKTTVLRMIGGFETPSSGRILIDGQDVTALTPARRKVGMVFQAYALFPNLTVAENVAFGLKVAREPASQTARRVDEMLELIKLPQLKDRYPYQLSGGQQQRVALARALAVRPKILLLDEPLSALDAKIRVSLREEIRAVQRELGITTVFVTHDQEEALSMSDRVVVMHNGRADQVGAPFEIYNAPKTRFVASFVGTLNLLEGVALAPDRLTIEGQGITTTRGLAGAAVGATVSLALRPEAIGPLPTPERTNKLEATVVDVGFQGALVRVKVAVGRQSLTYVTFNAPNSPPPERGTALTLWFGPDDVLVLADEA
ncbi:ABC transporter ATP-binding protein [Rhodospirillum rubrum]|nr:ABC transporter ATP-binding protein [Rhodospirillum rubrum]AEO46980.1 ABC transporter protein [Rhodospirillum rubrum F11]QXG80985.1 ABC transporter ATP-binding protein [Rhodospirillum rubrum]